MISREMYSRACGWRHFQLQYNRTLVGAKQSRFRGLTITKADRHSFHSRESQTQRSLSEASPLKFNRLDANGVFGRAPCPTEDSAQGSLRERR
jgi:hypothetical protein